MNVVVVGGSQPHTFVEEVGSPVEEAQHGVENSLNASSLFADRKEVVVESLRVGHPSLLRCCCCCFVYYLFVNLPNQSAAEMKNDPIQLEKQTDRPTCLTASPFQKNPREIAF